MERRIFQGDNRVLLVKDNKFSLADNNYNTILKPSKIEEVYNKIEESEYTKYVCTVTGETFKDFLDRNYPRKAPAKSGRTLKIELPEPSLNKEEMKEILEETILKAVNQLEGIIKENVDKVISASIEEEHNSEIEYVDINTLSDFTIIEFNHNVKGINGFELLKILELNHTLMLTGPAGVGKSTIAKNIAKLLIGKDVDPAKTDRIHLSCFNSDVTHGDIIGGYKNTVVNGKRDWFLVKGELMQIADRALANPDLVYVYIADEITRAEAATVLGEALLAMEMRGQGVKCCSGELTLTIPKNLYIIATANTVDNSVVNLDYALKTRFTRYNIENVAVSASSIIPSANEDLQVAMDLVIEAIDKINDILMEDGIKGSENRLGLRPLYSEINDIDDLIRVIRYRIKPDSLDLAHRDDKKEINKILDKLCNGLEGLR